jgi:serine/threonine protein phosphatase PrpC
MIELPETALLLGSDHTGLGEIATAQLGTDIAIALSRGKFPKGYPHLDDNEDAVLAATDGSVSLLAVADGHSGFDAARASAEALHAATPTLLEMARGGLAAAARHGFTLARNAIATALADLEEPRRSSRTALVICLVGEGEAAVACFGDTRAVLRSGRRARSLVGGYSPFLDGGTILDEVENRTIEITPGDKLVLASDGLFDFLGRKWLGKLDALGNDAASPLEFVTSAVRKAFVGGAGDNISVGVLDYQRSPEG